LKQPFWELFDELTRLQECIVVRLEFRHGLPLQLETMPYRPESDVQTPAPIRSTRSARK
jgi:hypothetical protein